MEVLDRATFDDFAGLFDPGELRGIVAEWRADTARALEAIAEARAGGDLERIGEIAHRAAGGALALGATAFASACERLRASAEATGDVSDRDVAAVRESAAATHAAMSAAAGL